MSSQPENFNAAASDNPLINPPALPYGAPAFDRIKTEHLEPAIDWAIAELQKEIEDIKNNPDMPSFANTIEALEHAGENLDRVLSVFHTFLNSNTNKDIQNLQKIINKKITPIMSDISMDDVFFARIKTVFDAKDKLGLANDQMMLLEKMYKSRVRSGALLPPEKKERLKEINTELSQKTSMFGENFLKHTASFEWIVTKDELKGVPEDSLETYKGIAEMAANMPDTTPERQKELKDNYLIGLQPPPIAILDHCENRILRKEIFTAMEKRCHEGEFDNSQLVLDIIKLRHESAQILGYRNHADFVLSDRMAGSPETVEVFLQKNLDIYKPSAEKHFHEIKEYAETVHKVTDFQPHDFSFYNSKFKEQKFNFDSKKLRPYFEIGRVLDGFHQHVEKLFHVKMVDCTDDYPAYRDDAKVYEVQDENTGAVKALFYADYFADPQAKRGGAWMNGFRSRALDKHGIDQIPIVTNSCNFQKPAKDQPSLLSLRDVQTIFHEGGHGFHDALTKSRYGSLAGTNVKLDFVELPSQLQENWATKTEVLQTYARHYQTDEVIPDAYIEKIQEMATYGAAMQGLRQTGHAMLDMLSHTTDPADIGSIDEIEDDIHARTSFWPERTGTTSTGFAHIFAGGYAAGYYSYKWAEVLDADVFEEFKKNGLYDAETSKRLLETIYEKGGNEPPMELFRKMMGRDPDPEALFRREGLLPEKAVAKEAPRPNTDAPKPS
ncbi:MAG: M3 family peptidase [Alphaproteobacteria bacterium CG_4_9_14_3_um_filter_47_13]|nr:MAG: M3 family peptidase [Alphaproteobacteria bacterium CG_4_9_14_3_um_filter_47_13]